MSDFNAHLGADDATYTFHSSTYSNGKLTIDYLHETNLMIGNTSFRKKKGKLWMHISDTKGLKSQVDYILINRKWKNSIKNCDVYSSFSSIGSDHRIVSAKAKISFRVKKKPGPPQHNWSALQNSTILEQYNTCIRNRYYALSTEDTTDASKDYNHFIKAHIEATKILPKKVKEKREKAPADTIIVDAREKVNQAFKIYSASPTSDNELFLHEQKPSLEENYNRVQEEEITDMVQKIELAHHANQYKLRWQLINNLTGRKNAKKGVIKGNNKQDRLSKWYEYFKNLLGKEPIITHPDEEIRTIFDNLDIPSGPFTMDEYHKVKQKLAKGKAAGPDGITPEVLMLAEIDDIILKFANNLLLNLEKPDQWSTSQIQPILKTGDLSEVGNYRDIALSPIAAKITNTMLLNRIQPIGTL